MLVFLAGYHDHSLAPKGSRSGLVGNLVISNIPITNYQMAPSKRGAGGGSATHKEPTLAPTAYTISCPSSNNGCHQPTLNPLLANVCQASPFRLAMC